MFNELFEGSLLYYMKQESNIISFFDFINNKQHSFVINTKIPVHNKIVTTPDKRIFLIDSDQIHEYLWMTNELAFKLKMTNVQI